MENHIEKEQAKSVGKIISVILGFLVLITFTVVLFSSQSKFKITDSPSYHQAPKYKTYSSELRIQAQDYFKNIQQFDNGNIDENLVALGKELYFDTQLSKDGNISCNSCHNLNTFGVDNLPTSPGDLGQFGGRNSPTSIYAATHKMQFWDGRANDVEEQAGMPILNPIEHNIPSKEFLVNRLKSLPNYPEMFRKAFPTEENAITYANLTKAIGAFERKLMPVSRFDNWILGDDKALTAKELVGMQTFIDKGCVSCHSGISLGGESLQKFGVYGNYWELTKSKNIDKGLFDITKKPDDLYVFKVPGLRNIEKTYPYFHDGSVKDLKNAVKIMGKLQLNKELNNDEIENIVAFLSALTADVDANYKK